MRIVLLVFYNAWLLGFGILTINTVSRFIFSTPKIPFEDAGRAFLFSLIWPIAIFSPQGRKSLLVHAQKL